MSVPMETGSRKYTTRPSVVRKIAGALGRTIGGVGQDLRGEWGAFRRAEVILEKLVAFGGMVLAQKQLARFAAILARREPPAFTGQLLVLESQADAAQDVARTELQAAMADTDPLNDLPAAKTFVRRCDNEMAFIRDVRDAVAHRWGL